MREQLLCAVSSDKEAAVDDSKTPARLVLAAGDSGAMVVKLQRRLAAAGFDPGPPDGIYGPRTRGAVMEMQRFCRLAVDGAAGPDTLKTLAFLIPHRPEDCGKRADSRNKLPANPGRYLSPHFKEQEFACRCCGMVRVNIYLVELLERLRERLGSRPVVITSGYRCPEHNQEVGGARNSQHLLGSAADIVVTGKSPAEVAEAAEKVGFSGVGRYVNFTHVDVRLSSPARWKG